MSTTGKFSRHQKNLQVIPRVALVYDRLTTEFGGAEQVLQVLHEIYPTAPVFTTVYDPQRARYANTWQVRTSWLQKCPGAQFFYRSFVWLMPLAIEDLPLSNFDIVISISSAEGKGVLTKPEQLHVCYMLTPTRYLWSHTEQYAHHPLTGWLRAVVFGYVRWWDKAAAFRPDYVIPISQLVAQRTQRYYSRVTEDVLYPPVSTNFSAGLPAGQTSEVLLAHLPHEFWFMVCRLVSYKRVDLAIRASAQLHQPLVVVGDGPDYHRLVKIAQTTPGAQVFFERSVQPGLLGAYYARCIALLAPGEEDFGIVALEAQTAGKPVILHHNSGAAEIVADKTTGIHIPAETVEALYVGMCEAIRMSWSSKKIIEHVRQYDKKIFMHTFAKRIDELWLNHQEKARLKGSK